MPLSSDSEDDDTLQTLSADEGHRYNRSKFSKSTKKILRQTKTDYSQVKHTEDKVDTTQLNIFHSLSMINSQLGQLLNRLPETSQNPHISHIPHMPHTPTLSDALTTSGTSSTRYNTPK